MSMSTAFCDICKVTLSGPEPARQHYASKKHKNKEMFHVMTENSSLVSASGLNDLSRTELKEVAIRVDASPALVQTPDDLDMMKEEYKFNGNRGFCNLCQIALTSASHMQQHLSGRPHLKKKTRFELLKSGMPTFQLGSAPLAPTSLDLTQNSVGSESPIVNGTFFRCDACDIGLNSREQLENHKMGAKHQKKVNDSALTSALYPIDKSRQLQGNASSNDNTSILTSSQQFAILKSLDNTKWYTCMLCHKRVNSKEQLSMHLRSHAVTDEQCEQLMAGCQQPAGCQQLAGCQQPAGCQQLAGCQQPAGLPTAINNFNTQSVQNVTPLSQSIGLHRLDFSHFLGGNLDDGIAKRQSNVTGSFTSVADSGLGILNDSLDDKTTTLRKLSMPDDPESLSGSYVSASSSLPHNEDENTLLKTISDIDTPSENPVAGIAAVNDLNLNSSPPSSLLGSGDLLSIPQSNIAADFPRGTLSSLDVGSTGVTRLEHLGDGISEGICTYPSCVYHCVVCDVHLSGKRPRDNHLEGTKHLKNQDKGSTPDKSGYCSVCGVPYNTEKDYRNHIQGKQHRAKIAKCHRAPSRLLPEAVPRQEVYESQHHASSLTHTPPRDYQVELYCKAMDNLNTVIFLPTGTGKTLVSVMVLTEMLRMNPYHNVVFLVDKVLLALQQGKVIMEETKHMTLDRWDVENGKCKIQRHLTVATLCGGSQEFSDLLPCQHDIIIATAGYYLELLRLGSMRWEDNCLAVFDEVHHSIGNHPYLTILKEFHKPHDHGLPPKLLGLTASPAGQDNMMTTIRALRLLLDKFGQAKLLYNTQFDKELSLYKSSTGLTFREVKSDECEEELRALLIGHLTVSIELLVDAIGKTTTLGVELHGHLNCLLKQRKDECDLLETITDCLDKVCTSRPGSLGVQCVVRHIQTICYSLLSLVRVSLLAAKADLLDMNDDRLPSSFKNAIDVGIPCNQLMTWLKYRSSDEDRASSETLSGPMVSAIVDEVASNYRAAYTEGQTKPIALVLVKRIRDAKSMAKLLAENSGLKSLKLAVVHVVGHGKGSEDSKGMSVKQQGKVLRDIANRQYQVIVATAVAEEGVDLPECDLVIQTDLFSCVRALVQVRGRARKLQSRLVALFRYTHHRRELEELLQKEVMMEKAAIEVGQNC